LIAIIIGIVMGAATQFLVKNTGLYNSGLSAITQGIARISNTLSQKSDNPAIQANATIIFNALFWGIYVLFNVPLFIFALKKIGKTFANLTIVFIVVTNLLGFGLSCIHNIDHVFLFGNSIAEGSKVDEPFSKSDNIFAAKGIYNIPFWFEPKVDSAVLPDQIFNPSYDPYKALLLFIYAFAYGLICSVTYAILYIVGGCSGGGDFLSIYYSSIKHRPLGSLLIAVNSSMLFFGFIIGSYLSCGIMNSQGFAFPFFFSANLIASFLSVVVFGLLLNKFFPIQRIVKVEIISERIMGIRDELFKSNFTHSMTISKNVGAYTLKEKDII
jgi:uncharacterized membrane-anchored protein YitT (DUF2179 family)